MKRSIGSILTLILVNTFIFLFTSCALTHPFKPTENTTASTHTNSSSSNNISSTTRSMMGTWRQARHLDSPWLGDEFQLNADTSWEYRTNTGNFAKGTGGIFSPAGTFDLTYNQVWYSAWFDVSGKDWTGFYFLDNQGMYFDAFRQETTDTNVMGAWKTVENHVAYRVSATNVQVWGTNFFTKLITSSNVDFSNAAGGNFRIYYKLSSTGEFGYIGSIAPDKARFIRQ